MSGGPCAARRAGLHGKRVLVTRARHQSESLSVRLRASGAIPIELPVIEIVPLAEKDRAEALAEISRYDWLVLTSANTVHIVAPHIPARGRPPIAAIGAATARALEDHGIAVDLVPDEFVAEAVLEALRDRGIDGKRILLPQAEVARTTLPDGLRAAGATVDVVPVYMTRMPEHMDQGVLDMVRSGVVDIVTFTSPSTVRNLLNVLGGALPSGIRVACIGPITAKAAEEAGLRVDVVAEEYSIPGLVRALIESEVAEHE